MAQNRTKLAPHARAAAGPQANGTVPHRRYETTADTQETLAEVLQGVMDDTVTPKKATTVVAVTGKIYNGIKLELDTAQKLGTRRKALPISSR